MIKRLLLIILGVVLCVTPLFAADKESPFLMEKRDFKKQFKTIALSPVDAAAALQMPDSVAAIIEGEVAEHFRKRGYTVVPSSVLAGIREKMATEVGGTEDALKAQAVREHSLRELWFRQRPDAVATIGVTMSRAQFAKDRAEWDGVKQRIEHNGRDKGYSGDIVVSSVAVAVYDMADRVKYINYGGIEVLQMREEAQLLPRPPESYFTDEKRVRKAAQIAMDPI